MNSKDQVALRFKIGMAAVILIGSLIYCLTPVRYRVMIDGAGEKTWWEFSIRHILLLFTGIMLLFLIMRPREVLQRGWYFLTMSAFLPTAFFICLSLCMVFAVLKIGAWPQNNRPDPQTIGLSIGLFMSMTLVTFSLFLPAHILLTSRYAIHSSKWACWLSVIYSVSVWILFIWMQNDPFGALEWLGD